MLNEAQEYLYENSNVFPNEMHDEVEIEYTPTLEEDEYDNYKRPFSPAIQYFGVENNNK